MKKIKRIIAKTSELMFIAFGLGLVVGCFCSGMIFILNVLGDVL